VIDVGRRQAQGLQNSLCGPGHGPVHQAGEGARQLIVELAVSVVRANDEDVQGAISRLKVKESSVRPKSDRNSWG
jgi:hypothetical protein